MDDRLLALMKGMPPEYIERLIQLQNQSRTTNTQELPKQSAKATPPSQQPMGIYRKNIYG
jgi:hypothetical protein